MSFSILTIEKMSDALLKDVCDEIMETDEWVELIRKCAFEVVGDKIGNLDADVFDQLAFSIYTKLVVVPIE